MDVDSRRVKRTKFGSTKYVFRSDVMRELRDFFAAELNAVLPAARSSTGPDAPGVPLALMQ